jgi:hypothetical protein
MLQALPSTRIIIIITIIIIIIINGATALLLSTGRLFTLLILYTVCMNLWMGDETVTRPLPTHRTTQIQNNYIHALSGIRTHESSI